MTSERKLTILQVSAAHTIAGAEMHLITLAREFGARGHRVLITTFTGRPFGDRLREMGLDVRPVTLGLRWKVAPRALREMVKLIRAEKVDIVHTHLSTSSINGTIAARLAGIPAVSTVHGLNHKGSFLLAHHLITVSEAAKANLRRQRVPEEKITVVHNGVDLRRFSSPRPREEARRRLNLPPDALVVGNIARLAEIKGYQYALEAIAKVKHEWPTLRYVIVGQGSELPMWQAQVRTLGIGDHVVFLGFRADVPEILSALDVLLFPSLMEAMPMALLEAMAMRVPVVATNVGGIPEVLGEGTGILVPPKDSDAIAGALRRLLKDPQARQRLGAAGRQRVEKNFTLELMVDGTLEVYRRLVSPGEGSR